MREPSEMVVSLSDQVSVGPIAFFPFSKAGSPVMLS